MVRGTTPTLFFKCELEWDNIDDLSITFEQRGINILQLEKSDCVYEDGSIVTKLTQEQTLAFLSRDLVEIQIKIKLSDKNVLASNIVETTVSKILDEEVM